MGIKGGKGKREKGKGWYRDKGRFKSLIDKMGMVKGGIDKKGLGREEKV